MTGAMPGFSIPYNPGRTSLWVKSGTGEESDLASWPAHGHRLGVTIDYHYGPEITKVLQRYRNQVSEVNDVQNYRKLLLGR